MRKLDDQLDEFGFQSKPGSTKGRMYSSRFYHKEIKMVIKNLILELINEASNAVDHDNRHTVYGFDLLNSQLRKKVEEL